MKKLLFTMVVAAFGAAFGAANDTILTFSTQGPDTYGDGSTVLDGERYALVWVKDGTAFAAEVTVSLIDLLNPGDLVFTIRNTERRRRQLATFRTKQNAYDVAQAALFACAPDGRFRSVNPAFLEMFGHEEESDVQKMFFSDLMDDEPMAESFASALAGEKTSVRITAQEDESGSEDVEIQMGPDLQGKKIVGVVGSIIRV